MLCGWAVARTSWSVGYLGSVFLRWLRGRVGYDPHPPHWAADLSRPPPWETPCGPPPYPQCSRQHQVDGERYPPVVCLGLELNVDVSTLREVSRKHERSCRIG